MSETRDRAETLRLVESALARQWPIAAEKRAELVAMLHGLAMSSDTKTRQRITAVRVILQAEGVSLHAVETAIKADLHHIRRTEVDALWKAVDGLEERRIHIPDVDERYTSPDAPAEVQRPQEDQAQG